MYKGQWGGMCACHQGDHYIVFFGKKAANAKTKWVRDLAVDFCDKLRSRYADIGWSPNGGDAYFRPT